MMKVAAYVRISKDAEGERWGVETQRKLIAERAEREGWQVHDWYEDNDTSASKRRGAKTRWAAMLRDAEAGLFEVGLQMAEYVLQQQILVHGVLSGSS